MLRRLDPELVDTSELDVALDLVDYRRRVFDLYARVRAYEPRLGWHLWRATRDELFAHHLQSALEAADRPAFSGLTYYDYRPEWRFEATLEPAPPRSDSIAHSGTGSTPFKRVGHAHLEFPTGPVSLALYSLDAYGGGLFLPFRDATAGRTTYGGGRYLIDTVKGADLGVSDNRLILDFNFAYHPSCVYSTRWSCPLSPPENHLPIAITAGEQMPATAAR